MGLVNEWDQQGRQHDEEQEVAEDEIGSEVTQLSDLAEELTTRLRDRVPTHSVPLAGPPSDVSRVGLELTSERKTNDQLVDESLDSNDCNHAKQGLRKLESFQEEHNFEEGQEHDDGNGMGDGSENRAELLAAHTKHWTHAAGHTEESGKDTSIDGDRSGCDDTDSEKRVFRADRDTLWWIWVVLNGHTGLSVDVQVRNQSDGDQEKRTNDFREKDVREVSSRHISGKL